MCFIHSFSITNPTSWSKMQPSVENRSRKSTETKQASENGSAAVWSLKPTACQLSLSRMLTIFDPCPEQKNLKNFLFFSTTWLMPRIQLQWALLLVQTIWFTDKGNPLVFNFLPARLHLLQPRFCKCSSFELWNVAAISCLLPNKPVFGLTVLS